ncbi:hypothetical protein HDU76_005698 [Blyttiomyces sp. JEL0837]|nr:hypothetical protein HDU76_005698 [Blyttiomyces sp. JEL0837]
MELFNVTVRLAVGYGGSEVKNSSSSVLTNATSSVLSIRKGIRKVVSFTEVSLGAGGRVDGNETVLIPVRFIFNSSHELPGGSYDLQEKHWSQSFFTYALIAEIDDGAKKLHNTSHFSVKDYRESTIRRLLEDPSCRGIYGYELGSVAFANFKVRGVLSSKRMAPGESVLIKIIVSPSENYPIKITNINTEIQEYYLWQGRTNPMVGSKWPVPCVGKSSFNPQSASNKASLSQSLSGELIYETTLSLPPQAPTRLKTLPDMINLDGSWGDNIVISHKMSVVCNYAVGLSAGIGLGLFTKSVCVEGDVEVVAFSRGEIEAVRKRRGGEYLSKFKVDEEIGSVLTIENARRILAEVEE